VADLSDFLGHVLAEITRARVAADVEAVRIAKNYAADPDGLLKFFAVPRLRLPNVEITAPMIVKIVPSGQIQKTDPDLLSQRLATDLRKLVTQQKLKITAAAIIQIIKADPSLSRGYVTPSSAEVLSLQIGDKIAAPASRAKAPQATHDEVVARIREQVTQTLQGLPFSPVGIEIDPTTAAVRESGEAAGEGGNLLYVKMSISEDALEIEFEKPAASEPSQPAPSPVIKRLSPE